MTKRALLVYKVTEYEIDLNQDDKKIKILYKIIVIIFQLRFFLVNAEYSLFCRKIAKSKRLALLYAVITVCVLQSVSKTALKL